MKKLIIIFLLITSTNLEAQIMSKGITGDYYLTGVMETACGFKLKADSSFEFYFSQGVLDRYGSGKWSVKNNRLFLNSITRHENDFAMSKTERVNNDSVTVKITDNNSMLFNYIDCIIKNESKELFQTTNQEGIAIFPASKVDSIILQFRFCPERSSVFAIQDITQNYFEFKIEQWLFEFFFRNFNLEIKKDELTGKNPVLEGEDFRYNKNQ